MSDDSKMVVTRFGGDREVVFTIDVKPNVLFERYKIERQSPAPFERRV